MPQDNPYINSVNEKLKSNGNPYIDSLNEKLSGTNPYLDELNKRSSEPGFLAKKLGIPIKNISEKLRREELSTKSKRKTANEDQLRAFMLSSGATPEQVDKTISSNRRPEWMDKFEEGIKSRSRTFSNTGGFKGLTVKSIQEDVADVSKFFKESVSPVTSKIDAILNNPFNPNKYISQGGEAIMRRLGRDDLAEGIRGLREEPITGLVSSALSAPADLGGDLAISLMSSDATPAQRIGGLANAVLKTVGPEIAVAKLPTIMRAIRAGGSKNIKLMQAMEETINSGISPSELEQAFQTVAREELSIAPTLKGTINKSQPGLVDGINFRPNKYSRPEIKSNMFGKPDVSPNVLGETPPPNDFQLITEQGVTNPRSRQVLSNTQASLVKSKIDQQLEALKNPLVSETPVRVYGIDDINKIRRDTELDSFINSNWKVRTESLYSDLEHTIATQKGAGRLYAPLKRELETALRTNTVPPSIRAELEDIFNSNNPAITEPLERIEVIKHTAPGYRPITNDLITELNQKMANTEPKLFILPDNHILVNKDGTPWLGNTSKFNTTVESVITKLNEGKTVKAMGPDGTIVDYKWEPYSPKIKAQIRELETQANEAAQEILRENTVTTRNLPTPKAPKTYKPIIPKTTETPVNLTTTKKAIEEVKKDVSDYFTPETNGGINKRTSSSNASSTNTRKNVGLPELSESPSTTRKYRAGNHEEVEAWARDQIARVDSGRKASVASEQKIQQLRDTTIFNKNKYNELTEQINKLIEDGEDASSSIRVRNEIRDKIDILTQANKYVGAEQSRAFSARNLAKFEDFTPAGLYSDWQASAGRKLTTEEVELSSKLGKRIEDLEKQVAGIENAEIKKTASQRVATEAKEAKKATTKSDLEKLYERRSKALDNIKKNWKEDGPIIMSDPFLAGTALDIASRLGKIAPDVLELAKTYIAEGAIKLEVLTSKIKEQLSSDGIDLEDGDIHRIIAGEYEKPKKVLTPEAEALKDIRKEAGQTVAVLEARMNKSLAKVQEQLRTGEFPTRPKKVIPPELKELQIKLEAAKIEAREMKEHFIAEQMLEEMGAGGKVWKAFSDASRSFVASTDLSAPFNQGAFLLAGRPITSARAAKDMIKALKSPEALRELQAEIKLNDYYEKAVAAGLELKTTKFHGGDEFFTSRLINKLPGISHSERAYTAYLNKLRMDTFANLVKSQEKGWFGKFGKAKELSIQELKETAEYVNTVTGVGTGKLAGAVKNLNQKAPLFFAPGYAISRWKTAFGSPLFNAIIKGNPRLATAILKDYIAFGSAVMGSLAMAKNAGYDIELDPRSSSFGKIRQGKVEVDPFGGLLTPFRTLYQNVAGRKNEEGETSPNNPNVGLGYYASGRLSPAAGTVWRGVFDRKAFNTNYDARTPEGWKNLMQDLLPIQVKSQIELGKGKLSPEQQVLLRIGILFGVNSNVKDKKEVPK